jgi:hypothetical protein
MAYVEPRQPTSSPDTLTRQHPRSSLAPDGRLSHHWLLGRELVGPRASCRARAGQGNATDGARATWQDERGDRQGAAGDHGPGRPPGDDPGAEQRDPEQHVGDQMADDVDDEVGAHHRIGAEPVQQTGVGTAVGQLRMVLVRSSRAARAENGSQPTTASNPPIVANQGVRE